MPGRPLLTLVLDALKQHVRSILTAVHGRRVLPVQFIDSDGSPLNESFGVRSRRLRPAAPENSYLASLDDYEVNFCGITCASSLQSSHP